MKDEDTKQRMINSLKEYYKTAFGYKWKYLKDIEGSTTIEKDGKIYYCSE